MITEEIAALFSYLAYAPAASNNVVPPAGWVVLNIYNDHDDPDGSGFGARVFHHASTDEYVVAFRGSDVEWNDWTGTNVELALGGRAEQLEQALQLVADLQKDGIDLSRVTFTGHSLGGGLASILAVFFNRPAINFAAAPFEYSVRDDLQNGTLPWHVTDYFQGYADYLREIEGPAPDNSFGLLRDAWQNYHEGGGPEQALAMISARERQQTHDTFATSDPVYLLSSLYPVISGYRKVLDIGSQTVYSATDRHDVRLITLLHASADLKHAFQTHSTLLETLADERLYAVAKEGDDATSFYVHLLRNFNNSNPLVRDLVDRFAQDVNRIRSIGGVSLGTERALIAAAIEYYNYADPVTARNFYSTVSGGVQFDLRQLPTWHEGPQSLDERAGRGSNALLASLPVIADTQGYVDLVARARGSSVWTVSSGSGSLRTGGLGESEVQVGATTASNTLSGAEGDDLLFGGVRSDVLDGGSGFDVLVGDGYLDPLAIEGAGDTLRGGAGGDYLLGGMGRDTLEGGDGEDVLIGGVDADYLQGGDGQDSYIYNSGDGADRILGGDHDGVIIFDGVSLSVSGALNVAGHSNTWVAVVGGESFYFHLTGNNDLHISRSFEHVLSTEGSSVQFTIENYRSGDLGITLPAAIQGASSIHEGGAATYSFSMLRHSVPSQWIRVSVGAEWHQFFRLVTGAETLAFNADGTIDIAIANEQNRFVYSLVSVGDVDQGGQFSLSAVLLDDQFQAVAGSQVSFAVDLDATDEPAATVPVTAQMIFGTDAAESLWIHLYSGSNEHVQALGGDDYIDASSSAGAFPALDDLIEAGDGNDKVYAYTGNDRVQGGSGVDDLSGGDGDDVLEGGSDSDFLHGGSGRNWLFADSEISFDAAREAGETAISEAGQGDWLQDMFGDSVLIGSNRQDMLGGSAGNDQLVGGGGDDVIFGDGGYTWDWINGSPPELRQMSWFASLAIPAPSGEFYQFTIHAEVPQGVVPMTMLGIVPGGSDVIYAGTGNDMVEAGGGDDLVDAGTGTDFVMGGGGADTILGQTGDDVLLGGGDDPEPDGNDFIDGGDDNDSVFGMGGDDVLYGGSGDDTLSGDQDELTAGADYLNGENGDDQIWGGAKSDTLIGGAGNDHLYGDDSDTTGAAAGEDLLDGGDGVDHLAGGGGADTLLGGEGDDVVLGDGDPSSDALRSSDTLYGGGGNDLMGGGGGGDTMFGGAGNDEMFGELLDTDPSDAGDDFIDGGEGDDTVVGNAGADTLLGGAGNDLLSGDAGQTTGEGNDHLDAGEGDDLLQGDGGSDTLLGGDGADILLGGAGDDYLDGGAGIDVLAGGEGNDTLVADSAQDALAGGAGDDTYVINTSDGRFKLNDTEGNNSIILNSPAVSGVELYMSGGNVFLRYPNGANVGMTVDTFTSFGSLAFGDSASLSVQQLRGTYLPGTATDNYVRLKTGVSTTQVSVIGHGNDLVLLYDGAVTDWVDKRKLNSANVLSRLEDGAKYGQPAGSKALVLVNWYLANPNNYARYLTGPSGSTVTLLTAVNASLRYFDGDEDSNELIGSAQADALRGYEGDDGLNAGDGNDLLIGGAGYDWLDGGTGSDVFVFNRGDAYDYLTDVSGSLDILRFGSGISSDELTLIESVNGLQVRVGAPEGGDSIFINSAYPFERGIERFEFADGSSWDAAAIDAHISGNRAPRSEQLLADVVATPNQPFSLTIPAFVDPNAGDATSLTYSALLSDGSPLPTWLTFDPLSRTLSGVPGFADAAELNVTILATDSSGLSGPVHFQLEVPLVVVLSGNESANQLTASTSDPHYISGAGGIDVLNGGVANDILIGGLGDDIVDGNVGSDTYLWNLGDGRDTISNTQDSQSSSIDTIQFGAGITPADVRVTTYLQNLSIFVRDPSTGIETRAFYNTYGFSASGDDYLDQVKFADGTIWSRADLFAQTLLGTAASETLTGASSADVIVGNGGNDQLLGQSGNDDLSGGSGNDQLDGGAGDDVYRFARGEGLDELIDTAGTNRIVLAPDILPSDVTLYRHSGAGLLPSGLNPIGADDLILVLDGGNQQIRVENYYAAQTPPVINQIQFSDGTIWDAAAIAARLVTQGGTAEAQTGSAGDDNFTVDHGSDSIVESANGGIDTATSSVNYTLPANVDNLTLTGMFARYGYGNSIANVITGNALDNILNGGAGLDTLIGGAGNDVYRMDTPTHLSWTSSLDNVIEGANEGYDTIIANGNYTAVLPDNVEVLIATGALVYDDDDFPSNGTERRLVGNGLDNVIDASATPILSFIGLVIDGGAGADLMIAPASSESVRFVVDNVGDQILYRSDFGAGATVETSVSYTLGEWFSNADLVGSDPISVVGNARDNSFNAALNPAANHVTGGDGDDDYVLGIGDTVTELPGGGSDRIQVAQHDSPVYTLEDKPTIEHAELLLGSGVTHLFGNALDNRLQGSGYLYGMGGNDSLDSEGQGHLFGGAGNDAYYIHWGDEVTEYSNEGIDTVYSNQSYTLGANVENLRLNVEYEVLNTNGYGNDLNNVMTGGIGRHVLAGGMGNDIYNIGSTWTTVVEYAGEGVDEVRSSFSWTLGDNIENLTLLASGSTGVGNELNNVLRAGFGGSILDGAAGADTLIGDHGNDLFIIDAEDTIVEIAGNGIDTVQVGFSYLTLAAELENVALTGSANLDANGNDSNNTLTGNAGTNVLAGGLGDDTYVIQNASDVVVEFAGAGVDTVQSYVSYSLAANAENVTLMGSAEVDAIGNGQSNRITGNSARNVLTGGAGNDVYVVQNTDDFIVELAGEGTETAITSVNFTLGANIENLTLEGDAVQGTGNELDNVLIGNIKTNVLSGAGGNDTLDGGSGADTLIGGTGDDTYFVGTSNDVIVEAVGQGHDTVRSSSSVYTLSDYVEDLVLVESYAADGSGSAQDNHLYGNTASNNLYGMDGNDTLDGGVGQDQLYGGSGDDTYIINDSDIVSELADQGTDTVRSTLSFTLAVNVENLILLGAGDLSGTGNALSNRIEGNGGKNVLDGGAGADTLIGGAGDDTYKVDNVADVVEEAAQGGTDLVTSTATHTLSANVENLTLTGSADINAIGNDLWNVLTGNSGDNLLDGGSGGDMMTGGNGNDTYVVDDESDFVIEEPDDGDDTVLSSISLQLMDNVERLTLLGTANLSATGNELANVLTGNVGDNVLDGGIGNDQMIGGAGNDTYMVNAANDAITEVAGGGVDVVNASATYTLSAEVENLTLVGSAAINGKGNGIANVITGNSAVNTLDGQGGIDTLIGDGGNDIYVVDDAADAVVEVAGQGTDLVQSAVSYTLSANVENLTLLGSTSINATGNELSNQITGNSGANILDGGLGGDSLIGGAGNDTYIVDAGDTVSETSSSGGTDIVASSVTHQLTSNVENLTLTGTANIDGLGNSLVNQLVGNSGNNLLDGGTGADTLTGGVGNDVYVVDNVGDTVNEATDEGIDEVRSTISYTLSETVERLTLNGTSGLSATGNSTDNVLTGNSGANRLDGGAGGDTMTGGAGDDTYVIESAGDIVIENATSGTDTVEAHISYTLGTDVERLTLMGSAAINATGNSLSNTLTGNSADNVLDGGAGVDVLIGGAGNDTYVLDNSTETITEAAAAGTDLALSSATYTLAINVENLTLTGTAGIGGTGNSADNILTGNSGGNALNGLAGADTMIGGEGDDAYTVENVGDVVTELAGQGVDSVTSSVSYTLGSNVENLTLSGTVNGAGNELDNIITGTSTSNTLTGNAGNDYLDGGSGGTDVLVGGTGDDTYVWRSSGVTITELSGEGIDTVRSSVAYTLTANLENLVMTNTSTTNITSTGNTANNVMTGGSGANTLNGADGDDTLNGMGGTDTLNGGLGADIYQYAAGSGSDTINNVSADSLIDRLQFTDLASSQITFSKSGTNLVMTQSGGTTNKVTVTNWFSATANRVDLVSFTNVEKSAADIDALFANGGTGGVFTNGSGQQLAAMRASVAETSTKPNGSTRAIRWMPIKTLTLDGQDAGVHLDSLGGLTPTTLGAKLAADEALATRWQPIKTFPVDSIDVGVNRLIDAMAMFADERNVGSLARDENAFAETLAAGVSLEFATRQRNVSEFRTLMD